MRLMNLIELFYNNVSQTNTDNQNVDYYTFMWLLSLLADNLQCCLDLLKKMCHLKMREKVLLCTVRGTRVSELKYLVLFELPAVLVV